MPFYLKITSYLATVIVCYKLRTYLSEVWQTFFGSEVDVDHQMVLFFPEKGIPLKDRQKDYNTLISSFPTTSLSRLLSVLRTCRQSLDICLFGFSFETIIRLIEDLSRRGVSVRVVVHRENDESIFSEEPALTRQMVDRLKETLKLGIELKIIGLSRDRLMHHKFAIIDNKILINGSFNWTENSIFNCFNDCVITSDPKLVIAFQREFSHIWLNDSF